MTTSSSATVTPNDVSGLVAAITRRAQEATLGRFLESYRWSVLANFVHVMDLKQGKILINQGALDGHLYFLESGDLQVDVKSEGGLVRLALLGPGNVVGEGSFFSKLPRSASVVAYSDCKIWSMAPADFEQLSRNHPSVALALSMALGAVVATRLLDLSKRIAVT